MKIQYDDVAFYDEVASLGTAEHRVNFQIWLDVSVLAAGLYLLQSDGASSA